MISPARKKQLEELQSRLKTSFNSEEILNQALTHSSFVNEQKRPDSSDNERLEFLGDAVLKLVISDYIYKRFPDMSEGELTKLRAAVVSDVSLSEIAKDLDLGQYLVLGRNEKRSGGERKKSNIANALEAIIAAVFLDGGIEKAGETVVSLLRSSVDKASSKDFIVDYKSALQELSQKNKWGLPAYLVAKEFGPRHKRIFIVDVKVKGSRQGSGKGLSKKEAEQNAAKEALSKLKTRPPKAPRPASPAPVAAAPAPTQQASSQRPKGLFHNLFGKRKKQP